MNNNPANSQIPVPVVTTPVSGQKISSQPVTSSTAHGKEVEAVKITSSESIQEVSKELEIPEEVEKAGVVKISETIELPPDIKKLGVASSGSSTPVATLSDIPEVVLPISDQQIIVGLHAKVTSALKWLSTWCIKKLKKAHVALKVIHGKIVRIKK